MIQLLDVLQAGDTSLLGNQIEGETIAASRPLRWMVIISTAILFLCSSVRHLLFQSNAWDLGIFDQPLYLLSQGLPPVSTIVNVHILGDHAAWIFYPLSLLYRIYPSVYWLFAVQAIALSVAAIPTWHLARQAGLKEPSATAIAAAYLLYPLIFNLNLFDFHPEVIALPLILTAIWAARAEQIGWFAFCIWMALGCRDALSLTIAAMGVWLWVFEQRRVCGAIACLSGLIWFVIATRIILPHFQPAGILGLSYYAEFGRSIPEIITNLLLRPDLVLKRLLTLANLEYLVLLFAPLGWGLSLAHLSPLVAAFPQLALNLISDSAVQKNLIHQYSLPILPFLVVMAIASLADQRSWIHQPRTILLWALAGFVALAQVPLFGSRYLSTLDTWSASRAAIAQITTPDPVLAPAALVPHLSHRPVIRAIGATATVPLSNYTYLLVNARHPGKASSPEVVNQLIQQASHDPGFQLHYHQDDVYLFKKQKRVSDRPTLTHG